MTATEYWVHDYEAVDPATCRRCGWRAPFMMGGMAASFEERVDLVRFHVCKLVRMRAWKETISARAQVEPLSWRCRHGCEPIAAPGTLPFVLQQRIAEHMMRLGH